MLATEMLDPDLARSLIPNDRVVSDTRKLVVYYRLSPDGHRILFGARVSYKETDPTSSAGPLRLEMLRIFPQLADAKITHSWMGFVGYTFDKLPHLGEDNGLFYAMGYCGSGICLSSYFGHRLGQQALGIPDAKIPMNGLRFETRPFYRGYRTRLERGGDAQAKSSALQLRLGSDALELFCLPAFDLCS